MIEDWALLKDSSNIMTVSFQRSAVRCLLQTGHVDRCIFLHECLDLVRTPMMLIRAKTTFTWKCCLLSSALLAEDTNETASVFLAVIDRSYSRCLLNLPLLFVLDRSAWRQRSVFPEYDSAKEDNKHHCQILLSSTLSVSVQGLSLHKTSPVSPPHLQYTGSKS